MTQTQVEAIFRRWLNMSQDNVTIKGVNDGLLISLDEVEEWLTVTADLAAKIDNKNEFYAGARVTIDVGTRPVPKYELSGLRALLERRNLELTVVVSDSTTTLESANALDLRTGASTEGKPNEALPISPEEEGTNGVLIKRTLRSGRVVKSQGHVVILGDVNPGAEIVAHGDIIIWGRLRGNVHAGANGDESVMVCALDMTPNQLRIADYITTSPSEPEHNPTPEIALIRDSQIVVETWKR